MVQIVYASVNKETIDKCLGYFIPDDILNEKNVFAYVAIDEEKGSVGALAASAEEGIIEIRYLSVLEPYQRQGIGRMLVTELLKVADMAGQGYRVNAVIIDDLAHFQVKSFFSALHVFELIPTETNFYFSTRMQRENAMLKKIAKAKNSVNVISLNSLLKKEGAKVLVNRFVKTQQKNGLDYADDLLKPDLGGILRQFSFAVIENDSIEGIILVYPVKKGVLNVGYIYSRVGTTYFIDLIRSLNHVLQVKPNDLIFTSVNENIKSVFADKFGLLPDTIINAIWNGILPQEMQEFVETIA